jgi:hypothetical protein
LEAFGGLGLADLVVEILIDEGSACFPESTGEFGGAEFEKEDKDYEVRESEDEDGADLSEDGGEKFIVEEISDVAAWHFTCGGGSAVEALGARAEGVGEGGSEDGGGELEEAGTSDEKDSEKDKFLGVADFFGKEEEEAACDKDDGKKIGTESKKEEEDSAEVGAGGTDEVSFWILRGLRVERQVAGIEGE